MGAANWASVTDTPCSCKYLENSAADPNTPIRYDPELNEYNFVHSFENKSFGSIRIYHCPFCGGLVPESTRDKLFAVVPEVENARLRSLTSGIRSVEDALQVLGTPCSDQPIKFPEGYIWPVERGAKTPTRALTFTRLSEVADIQVLVNDDNSVEVTCGPKYIGRLKKGV